MRRAAAAGLPTDLRLEGDRRPLPPGIDLTAYRVVQEALTAARDRGQAGHAQVAVRYGDEDVLVEVADDGAREGRRLLGMRERVAVYGGELTTAPSTEGGWRVAARLPRGGGDMTARLRAAAAAPARGSRRSRGTASSRPCWQWPGSSRCSSGPTCPGPRGSTSPASCSSA